MGVGDPRDFLWGEACAMIERAERLHRQFFQPGFSANQAASWEPPVDIFETEGKLWIIAALPGVEPQNLDISIDGDVLRVAFKKGGRVIEHVDHPLLNRLRG